MLIGFLPPCVQEDFWHRPRYGMEWNGNGIFWKLNIKMSQSNDEKDIYVPAYRLLRPRFIAPWSHKRDREQD